jgi:hypothetical protein
MNLFVEHADVGEPLLKPLLPGSKRDSATRLDASAMSYRSYRSYSVESGLRLAGNYTPFNSALRVVASVTTTTHTETAEKNTLAITRHAESYELSSRIISARID